MTAVAIPPGRSSTEPARLGRSRMTAGDLLATGALGLSTRKLRAALSVLGIAIGIAAVVGVLGLSQSSKADLLARLDRLGTNLLTVTPGQTFGGQTATLPDAAAPMIARIAPVRAASGVTDLSGVSVRRNPLIDENVTGGITVTAADLTLLTTLRASVASGHWLNSALARYPTVVLGSTAAERLGVTRTGVRVWMGDRWFTVVGILDSIELAPEIDRSALVGRPVAEELLDAGTAASRIYVRSDVAQVDAVGGVLPATANPASPNEVSVSRPSDALAARAAAKGAFTSLFLALGGVALLVGGVGIANVMVISVLERRSEIGLRRGLGATRRHVAGQFLVESLLLSVLGGLLGAAAGVGITLGWAHHEGWRAVIPAAGVAGGLGVAVAIGALAGLYPATRAARLPPTDALRSV